MNNDQSTKNTRNVLFERENNDAEALAQELESPFGAQRLGDEAFNTAKEEIASKKMTRPLMFLIAGVNGAGKSTFSKTIVKKYPLIKVIDPDFIAKQMTGSFATIETEAVGAGRVALLTVQQCIASEQSFIVESTIAGRSYLNYLKQAKDKGFKTILIYVALASAQMSAERIAARVQRGGHSIPADDVKRRYPKSFENLKAHLNRCDIGYIYDNSKQYKLVASYRNGVLYKQNELPDYIKQYL